MGFPFSVSIHIISEHLLPLLKGLLLSLRFSTICPFSYLFQNLCPFPAGEISAQGSTQLPSVLSFLSVCNQPIQLSLLRIRLALVYLLFAQV